LRSAIADRPVFQRILYAQAWEDPGVLCDALEPGPGDHVLSIAAAGDNSLALLLAGAGEVTALDLSLPQTALCELKVQGIRKLEYEEFLVLLGLRDSPGDPQSMYRAVRDGLSADARGWWDAHADVLSAGALAAGKFERYFKLFRTRVLPWVHSRRRSERLLGHEDVAEQARWFDRHWDTFRWRLVFRMFFSERVLARRGRDASFFEHVEGGSVSARFLARTRRCMTTLPAASNWFLEWILTGRYRDLDRAHPYLGREGFRRLKEERLTDRLHLRLDEIERFLPSVGQKGFSRFNLSDIFEYMDPEASARVYEAVVAASSDGARVAYWNLLVPRSAPASLAGRVEALTEKAEELHARDKVWFYERFVLETVNR
jgi:S-adenosylmethionine-diacylglycerol 3-amino-3-carboxypropyl transferase